MTQFVKTKKQDIARRFYTALLLPFEENLQIDEAGLRSLVRYYVDNSRFSKVGGLIANPEAGEAFYLTREEKRRVLEIVLEEAAGQMPVLAGTFAWTTEETVQIAVEAKSMGVDGIFVVPPAGSMDVSLAWDSVRYPEVWLDQIKAQDDAVDLPIFTHPITNASQPWGMGLPLEPTLKFCREVPNIVGWKMTYAYLGHRILSRALREQAPDVALLCSSAHFFHEFLSVGNFDGTISGSWNYALEPMLDHIEAFQRNDLVAACKVWNSGLAHLHEYIYAEPGRLHVRYKIAAWLRGLIASPRMRPPMPTARPEEIKRVAELMTAAGLQVVH
jgi:dihydrodipicolinate synthase/N-acetylneuraminate lyase